MMMNSIILKNLKKKISSTNNNKIYKISKKIIYALKVMKVKTTTKNFQKFFQESELINSLEHPKIL